MDHGGMDHGQGARCSMHMLWNTQIVDTCVVFQSWHVRTQFGFFLSFLSIVLLGILYERLRKAQRLLDIKISASLIEKRIENAENQLLLPAGPKTYVVPPLQRVQRAILYGVSTFLSFFLMLVFMTYNAYLISAVVLGATIGHYIYSEAIEADAILFGTPQAAAKNAPCC